MRNYSLKSQIQMGFSTPNDAQSYKAGVIANENYNKDYKWDAQLQTSKFYILNHIAR